MAVAGTLGLPAVRTFSPRVAHARSAPAYDPAACFDLAVSEVEFRRNSAGRMLMARIYQPKGSGPFPTVLDLHGGAWNRKDRFAEEPMDRALAASGLLVVAVDLTKRARDVRLSSPKVCDADEPEAPTIAFDSRRLILKHSDACALQRRADALAVEPPIVISKDGEDAERRA